MDSNNPTSDQTPNIGLWFLLLSVLSLCVVTWINFTWEERINIMVSGFHGDILWEANLEGFTFLTLFFFLLFVGFELMRQFKIIGPSLFAKVGIWMVTLPYFLFVAEETEISWVTHSWCRLTGQTWYDCDFDLEWLLQNWLGPVFVVGLGLLVLYVIWAFANRFIVRMQKPLLFFVLILYCSCNKGDRGKTFSSIQHNGHKQQIENFDEFFTKFSHDPSFKKQRTKTPFPYNNHETDDNSGEEIVETQLLEHLDISFDKSTWEETVVFKIKKNKIDTTQVFIQIEDTGYNLEVIFAIDPTTQTWFAVEANNYST